jgi:hypothetical protein
MSMTPSLARQAKKGASKGCSIVRLVDGGDGGTVYAISNHKRDDS